MGKKYEDSYWEMECKSINSMINTSSLGEYYWPVQFHDHLDIRRVRKKNKKRMAVDKVHSSNVELNLW